MKANIGVSWLCLLLANSNTHSKKKKLSLCILRCNIKIHMYMAGYVQYLFKFSAIFASLNTSYRDLSVSCFHLPHPQIVHYENFKLVAKIKRSFIFLIRNVVLSPHYIKWQCGCFESAWEDMTYTQQTILISRIGNCTLP